MADFPTLPQAAPTAARRVTKIRIMIRADGEPGMGTLEPESLKNNSSAKRKRIAPRKPPRQAPAMVRSAWRSPPHANGEADPTGRTDCRSNAALDQYRRQQVVGVRDQSPIIKRQERERSKGASAASQYERAQAGDRAANGRSTDHATGQPEHQPQRAADRGVRKHGVPEFGGVPRFGRRSERRAPQKHVRELLGLENIMTELAGKRRNGASQRRRPSSATR